MHIPAQLPVSIAVLFPNLPYTVRSSSPIDRRVQISSIGSYTQFCAHVPNLPHTVSTHCHHGLRVHIAVSVHMRAAETTRRMQHRSRLVLTGGPSTSAHANDIQLIKNVVNCSLFYFIPFCVNYRKVSKGISYPCITTCKSHVMSSHVHHIHHLVSIAQTPKARTCLFNQPLQGSRPYTTIGCDSSSWCATSSFSELLFSLPASSSSSR
jgi:hypothetical protein